MPLHGSDPCVDPLTPPDCDISDWPGMMLDVARLQKSRAWLICKSRPHLAFFMLNLWMAAWHAVPAASLENDDEVLADAAKCRDVDHWLEMKADVLRGFTLCADGRWYHEVIAIKALEVWIEKIGSRISSGAGNAKRWGGEFNEAPLKGQLQIAKDLLQTLDPMSKVFARSRAGVTKTEPTKPARAPRKPRTNQPEPAPAAAPADSIPAGGGRDADEIAIEGKGSEGKGREENLVGDTSPTTPGAPAPVPPARPAPPPGKPAKPAIEYAKRDLVLPEWLAPHGDAWKAFEEIRWAKHPRAPYTAEAQRRVLLKLEGMHNDGQDLHAVLEASITGGWTDVYPQRNPGRAGGGGGGTRFAGAGAAVFGTSLPRGGH